MGKPKYWLLGRSYPFAKAPREETLSLQCPKNPVPVIRCGREASIAQGLGHFLVNQTKGSSKAGIKCYFDEPLYKVILLRAKK